MARSRPVLNVTRLRARRGQDRVTLEVLLLGPDPSRPSSTYSARLTVAPEDEAIELEVGTLLRALTPALPEAG